MDTSKKKQHIQTVLSALLWIGVWQLGSAAIGEEIFLPSPLRVVQALWGLLFSGVFWGSVFASLLRIGAGFFAALVLGVLLACAAAANGFVEILLRPLLLTIKATPVASFTILALVWIPSRNLSALISFLMALPVIYSSTLGGIRSVDASLLEMSQVFHIGFWRRVRAVYLPTVWPSLLTACDVSIGLSWKSGVAAEVIGQARYSIGGQLYFSKINVLIPDLFAWTVVVILVTWLFGYMVKFLLGLLYKGMGRRWVRG